MKKWEIGLLLGLAFTLLWGAVNVQRQQELADSVIRLHVLANSDSDADQALKLQVRDRVLAYAEDLLTAEENVESAAQTLSDALEDLRALAAEEITARGYGYSVQAELTQSEFPRRDYDTFSLPKGQYLALRVTIGEGQGRNWWCVVYPDLCHVACTDWEGLEKEQISFITEETPCYKLRFRTVELWQTIRQKLGK